MLNLIPKPLTLTGLPGCYHVMDPFPSQSLAYRDVIHMPSLDSSSAEEGWALPPHLPASQLRNVRALHQEGRQVIVAIGYVTEEGLSVTERRLQRILCIQWKNGASAPA